jgi:hypothetical protein
MQYVHIMEGAMMILTIKVSEYFIVVQHHYILHTTYFLTPIEV